MNDEKEKKDAVSGDANEEIVFEDEEGGEGEMIRKFRAQLKECEKEKREYLEGWQRAKADYINAKKEEEKRREEFVKFSRKDILLDLISVADSFNMAFANKEAWEKIDANWRTGMEYIFRDFLGVIERYGLTPFDPKDLPFDPERHVSLGDVETENTEDLEKVAETLKKGYELLGTVVRPAHVKVYSQKGKEL